MVLWNNSAVVAVMVMVFFAGLLSQPGGLCAKSAGVVPQRVKTVVDELISEHSGLSGVYVLEKGEESLIARAWLTDNTVKSIDVQYFIWSTDNIGILAAEALLNAAERGIKVRVIVDDLLIDAPDDSMLALAAHANIEVRIYNPKHSVGISLWQRIVNLVVDFRLSNQRMHDKVFLVDGRVAVTGGRNMADEYFDYDHDYNFRDRDVLLLGPVVERMEENFDNFWQNPLAVPVGKLLQDTVAEAQRRKIYAGLHAYAADTENFAPEVRRALLDFEDKFQVILKDLVWAEIVFLSDIPEKNRTKGLNGGGQTTSALVKVVSGATKSIRIQSPYLVMPEGALELFSSLVKKGVKVEISTNSLASTDNLQAFSGYLKQRSEIIEKGIRVYEYRPNPAIQEELVERYKEAGKDAPVFAIHAKTMVIDGETLFVGTFNLDPRSANLNTEVGVLIRNAGLAGQVEEYIIKDMLPENSWDPRRDNPESHVSFSKRLKVFFWKLLPLTPLL